MNEGMDRAAHAALAELVRFMKSASEGEKQTVGAIADWFRRNYRAAGYKRLARILMNVEGE